jgi:hypothetical protein
LEKLCPSIKLRAQGLKSVCENCVASTALEHFVPLYPALTHWANGFRLSAAVSSVLVDHRGFHNPVPTHALKARSSAALQGFSNFSATCEAVPFPKRISSSRSPKLQLDAELPTNVYAGSVEHPELRLFLSSLLSLVIPSVARDLQFQNKTADSSLVLASSSGRSE